MQSQTQSQDEPPVKPLHYLVPTPPDADSTCMVCALLGDDRPAIAHLVRPPCACRLCTTILSDPDGREVARTLGIDYEVCVRIGAGETNARSGDGRQVAPPLDPDDIPF